MGALPAPLSTRGPEPGAPVPRPLPGSLDARHRPSFGGSEHFGDSARPLLSPPFPFLFARLLRQVLVVARGTLDLHCCLEGFSWSRWNLVSPPGIEPMLPVLGAHSLSHWTTREVPAVARLDFLPGWNFLFPAFLFPALTYHRWEHSTQ